LIILEFYAALNNQFEAKQNCYLLCYNNNKVPFSLQTFFTYCTAIIGAMRLSLFGGGNSQETPNDSQKGRGKAVAGSSSEKKSSGLRF